MCWLHSSYAESLCWGKSVLLGISAISTTSSPSALVSAFSPPSSTLAPHNLTAMQVMVILTAVVDGAVLLDISGSIVPSPAPHTSSAGGGGLVSSAARTGGAATAYLIIMPTMLTPPTCMRIPMHILWRRNTTTSMIHLRAEVENIFFFLSTRHFEAKSFCKNAWFTTRFERQVSLIRI